jgi:hypothetical protein
VPGGITEPPCSWGCKYGDLTLQVRGVSEETLKYARLMPVSNCTANYKNVLSSERTLYFNNKTFETVKIWSLVPRDPDPRETALTRPSNCKLQTLPPVRKDALT